MSADSKCDNAKCFKVLYEDSKAFFNKKNELLEKIKTFTDKTNQAKNVYNEFNSKLQSFHKEYGELANQPHAASAMLIAESNLYVQSIKDQASRYVEEAKKLQTRADNERQEADDLFAKAKLELEKIKATQEQMNLRLKRRVPIGA